MTDQKPSDERRIGACALGARWDDHYADIRSDILKAALPHAGFDGWNGKLLVSAAQLAEIDGGLVRLAFPDGGADLAEYFCADGDARMTEALGQMDMPGMKIRERIDQAVRTRLSVDDANREALRRAVTLLGLPIHAAKSTRALYHTVDAMWVAAGDTSTDYNFYSKRAVLAGVYSTTLLVWFSDHTADYVETYGFLERRIGDVMTFEKFKARARDWRARVPSPLSVLAALRYPGVRS